MGHFAFFHLSYGISRTDMYNRLEHEQVSIFTKRKMMSSVKQHTLIEFITTFHNMLILSTTDILLNEQTIACHCEYCVHFLARNIK